MAKKERAEAVNRAQRTMLMHSMSGYGLMLQYDFLKLNLTLLEAVALSYISDNHLRPDECIDGRWVRVSVKKMMVDLQISDSTQCKVIRGLKRKGLIKTDMRGGPPARRWMRINHEKLTEKLMEVLVAEELAND